MKVENPLVSDDWGDWFAVGLTAVVLAVAVVEGFLPLWKAGVGMAAAVGLSYLLNAVLSEPEFCDAPYCVDGVSVKVTDEHGFCAEHAGEFYEAVDERREGR